jgi:hypothetical protein
MEMKIQLIGAGLGIPKTKIGLSLGSGCWFGFRHTPKSPPIVYAVVEEPNIGENSGKLLIGYVQTNWFTLLIDKNHVIPNIDKLAGKIADLSLDMKLKHADFTFKIISPAGDITHTITKADVAASGLLLSRYETRGELNKSPKVDPTW